MNPIVEQVRNGFKSTILHNVAFVRWYSYPTKDNGNGVLVENRDATPTIKAELLRLTHEQSSVPSNSPSPVGLGTSFSMFAELTYDSVITEGITFVFNGEGWRTGPVDQLKTQGMTYGKRTPLTKTVLSADKNITACSFGTEDAIITGTSISQVVEAGTDLSSLELVIEHNGVMFSPQGAQDFSDGPVTFTVYAEDLSTKDYIVTVTEEV